MNRSSWLLERRQKESFAFLVVQFFRAYRVFDEIYRDFKALEGQERSFEAAGLFGRIRDLEEQIVFDIKEKAHSLFRKGQGDNPSDGPAAPGFADLERDLLSSAKEERLHEETRSMFAALRRSLVDRTLDAYIGTGFHMFMILRESLYQLESYAPRYEQEMEQVQRIEELTRRMGYVLDPEEEHELAHIRQVGELCQGIAADTRELASIALERCRTLFRETAEIMRHSIEATGENEVLVLNLLRERDLVDSVYGPGAWESILEHMFRCVERPGCSGREKALSYAFEHCSNIEGL